MNRAEVNLEMAVGVGRASGGEMDCHVFPRKRDCSQ